ncbi:MAG: hypothetical protein LWX23_03065 [Spirochaetia bacterium]|mgnify:FL=1|jgi:hypothetical protein|uniref:Outer membrane protein beta-barrel domain-containing protein n=1 Tax=bioreactor metagenome TaxID=1076179 RepID=A0A644TQ15_9ZZZZ|nr:hypothetical protein [Spirochaetia bacterium]MDD3821068.1 hypothetical protein [Spirochaetales bacterium]NLX44622.1 hypothetical protein [Treponema sp.]HAP54724.1 hypothetical protein [Spirochaetaceae bacterium]MCE1208437.1 hypothetical protein [Spirochaetia bacterium]
MKKAIAVLLLLAVVSFGVYAQGKTNMDKGDFAASIGLNFGWGFGVGGGVEMILARWDIADTIPITFGVAGKAGLSLTPWFETTIAALGTAHFGLATFTELPEWARKFDWYTALGLGLGLGGGTGLGIGIATGGGVSYHFNSRVALIAESIWAAHFNRYSYGFSTIGVQFKL